MAYAFFPTNGRVRLMASNANRVDSGPPPKSPSDIASRPRRVALSSMASHRWRALAPLFVLVVLAALISVANPNFLEVRNLIRIANSASAPLTLAMGTTFIILLGSIDLSVEGAVSLSAMVLVLLAANNLNDNNYGWAAVAAAVAASTFMGLASGVIQTMLRIPSFMATLGTWFIGLGFSVFMLGGSAVRLVDPALRGLALSRFLGLPFAVWIAAAAFAFAVVVQYYTRVGRHIVAVGGGEDVAELSGINLRASAHRGFRASRILLRHCGRACSRTTGPVGRGDWRRSHVRSGDCGRRRRHVFTGGEGGVVNTLIGVIIVTVLSNGMILLGISPYVQQTVQGLMIIAAVALTLDRTRLKIVK